MVNVGVQALAFGRGEGHVTHKSRDFQRESAHASGTIGKPATIVGSDPPNGQELFTNKTFTFGGP